MNEFSEIFAFTVTIRDALANLGVALFCGFIISLVYRYTYKGLNYSASFAISMVMLTMITAIVIMVIGNNLARAFGMVGAMSIIRFRTAVKDAADIMFIFFSLAIGLACGVKLYAIAVTSTFFVSGVYLLFAVFDFGLVKRTEYLLQILVSDPDEGETVFEDVIRKHAARHRLVNSKLIGEPGTETLELSYHVFLKDQHRGNNLIAEIKRFPIVRHVNLFFDEN